MCSRSPGATRCWTSRSSWSGSRSRTSTSSATSCTRTWTSTRASSTRRWASRWPCSRCCSRSAGCPAGWPSGRKAPTTRSRRSPGRGRSTSARPCVTWRSRTADRHGRVRRRPAMTWLDLPPDSPFGISNLPYGVFSADDGPQVPRVGVRIGDSVLDLAQVLDDPAFGEPALNAFMAQGRSRWSEGRARITELLTAERHRRAVEASLPPLSGLLLHLPFVPGDYADFFGNEYHAANAGRIFRPGAEPLAPNWKYLPVGYHGRSGTIVASGTPVTRPRGQRKGPQDSAPEFGPSRRLDFEAEVGFVLGTGSPLGTPVAVGEFADHVFGAFLLNGWSARDLQAWESTPLGPFLAKSFATSISPWIVPLDALEHARISPPPRDPEPLPYLADVDKWGLDLALEVRLNGHVVASPPFATMYWTPAPVICTPREPSAAPTEASVAACSN